MSKVKRFVNCLIVLAALAFVPASARAWGCMGHQVVAMLAYDQLNPDAMQQAKSLLADLSAYSKLHHFCSQPSLPAFGAVSTWADDIRDVRPETAPWHFIDIPLSASPSQYASFCDLQKGCVTSEIAKMVDTLQSAGANPAQKTEALIFLIHFVGDVHQPLHDETNNDRGANCMGVGYFGQQPVEGKGESYKPNLHGVWDTEMVERTERSHQTATAWVHYIEAKYQQQIRQWAAAPPDVMAWAAEAHAEALSIGYRRLHVPVPIEQPVPVSVCSDDNNVGHRLAALHEQVDLQYFNDASPVIEAQLTKAGTRLAALLNRIWP